MSEVWTRWQGHVISGAFPLRRYLGCSDHSAVFLTEVTAGEPREVALKLVPAHPARASLQLAHWNMAGGLAHPHLIRLLEIGRCQLGGLPYLYAVMEYADQNLTQVLRQRALTDDEAREMLLPTLSALAYLHKRNLVQGQLKPANIVAVGDQLKLASDTIRPAGEATVSLNMPSVYDPPEARQGSRSTASDIWALGVTLFEALTRSPPFSVDERDGAFALPPDFSPAFREVVARCLCRRPHDRPNVTEIEAWIRGQSAGVPSVATLQPAPTAGSITDESAQEPAIRELAPTSAAPGPRAPTPIVARTAAPVSTLPERAASEASRFESTLETARRAVRAVVSQYIAPVVSLKWRSFAPLILGAVALLALGGAGMRLLRSHRNPMPPTVQSSREAPLPTPSVAPPVAPDVPSHHLAGPITRPGQTEGGTSASGLHEEIPDVPRSASRTVRGHIKVYVRVMVDKDGTVYAALADRRGPSRYFERLAIEAAKKWTFPPADADAPRFMQVRFDFSRRGTTGRAVALDRQDARAAARR